LINIKINVSYIQGVLTVPLLTLNSRAKQPLLYLQSTTKSMWKCTATKIVRIVVSHVKRTFYISQALIWKLPHIGRGRFRTRRIVALERCCKTAAALNSQAVILKTFLTSK